MKQAIRPAIFKWRQTEPELILCAVRWYLRYSLSFRDVEELLSERGLEADHTTIWRWVQRLRSPNWRSGCAVISNQPTGPGVSMRPTFVSRAVGATSTEPSIPPAPRSTSCSRACAMPLRPNACSARRSLIRRIRSPVSSTRTRPALYGSAIAGVKKEGLLRRRCRHRPVQYLNNILEQDHRAIKRRVKAKQGVS